MMLSLSFRSVVHWFTIYIYIYTTCFACSYSHTTSVILFAASCFIQHIFTAFPVFCTFVTYMFSLY